MCDGSEGLLRIPGVEWKLPGLEALSFLADLNPGGCTAGAAGSQLVISCNPRTMLLAMLVESGALYAQLGVT